MYDDILKHRQANEIAKGLLPERPTRKDRQRAKAELRGARKALRKVLDRSKIMATKLESKKS